MLLDWFLTVGYDLMPMGLLFKIVMLFVGFLFMYWGFDTESALGFESSLYGWKVVSVAFGAGLCYKAVADLIRGLIGTRSRDRENF